MMPGLDPRALKKMMKQMGMDMQDIPASEVIIKKPEGGQIVIKNPQVQKMKVPGQGESFQVMGNATESSEIEISQDDINLVAEQAKVPMEKAKEALEKAGGDIAKAILSLERK
ncbi:TPA: nascent polypeptide-associated complex protein [archaeon]|uniref:Nascent polypeptide-associated complex protein n=1 Tax=Candidatus Naiadarchaeum limnaeum TaxID=2756139 RepID=A0A832UVB5_9ARCH|nr:nascent polypeptide-associated complex protein [Candidatus Naiadarchaeum limnaeum]